MTDEQRKKWQASTMVLIAVEVHDFQLQYAAWLGEGSIEKGIQRALNYANNTAFNHPTPHDLTIVERYNPEWDYLRNCPKETK